MSDGARSAEWYRAQYSDKSISGTVLAAGTGVADAITPKSANHAIYVQKIVHNPTTAAAQTVTYRDGAGTPIVLAVVAASASAPITIDFGARGFKLTTGEELDVVNVAGPAYAYTIEAYEKLENVISYLAADQ